MIEARQPGLVVVEDQSVLARTLAERIVEAARDAIAARGRFDLALSGGSTPKEAYRLLAKPPLSSAVDWPKARFFFGDERCVPPNDEQSNYKMARETIFDPLRIAAERVFRIRGEDEPARAAHDYADVLKTELGPNPVFDLMLLGMGPDGHTASLFPGADPCEDDELLVRAVFSERLSAHRITVTPRVINAAREVLIAAAGSEKAATLALVLEGPYQPARLPIQIVAPADGRLGWLVDRAAASALGHRAA